MSRGSLLQLQARGVASQYIYNNASAYTISNETQIFQQINNRYSLNISRIGDTCIPKYIQFVLNENNLELLKEGTFNLIIGGNIISQVPLKLLFSMEAPRIIGNNVILSLPSYLFGSEIILLAAQYHEIKLQIDYEQNNPFINEIKLLNEYKFLDGQQISSSAHEKPNLILSSTISNNKIFITQIIH